MKVTIIKNGKIAINPSTIITLTKDETFVEGTKGVTVDNLDRMVELGFATVIDESTPASEVEDSKPDADYEFMDIADKAELFDFAVEFYNVELDKRKNLKKMKADLISEITKKEDK